MNNHLLPFPYNQSNPPTWQDYILQPLSNTLLSKWPKQPKPQKPLASPISIQNSTPTAGPSSPPIRIICISDTHNATLSLPLGDVLIHAGDLTAHGTFDEIQTQLSWLSSQPHAYKIVIAGNHDILLDEACDAKFATRLEDSIEQRKKLDWGSVQYLRDEAITLSIPIQTTDSESSEQQQQVRKVRIYGSPSTPECGTWAFQYPAIRDVWTGRVPDDTDILVVHGPPALNGDCDGETGQNGDVKVKGDGYLLREIWRVRPKIVVCGHIHGAFGISVVRHDGVQDAVDGLRMRWPEHGVFGALRRIVWSGFGMISGGGGGDSVKETAVVNAAFSRGVFESVDKSAIAVNYY